MHETRDSGENNEMWFLYQGHSYKEDSEYLGSCAKPQNTFNVDTIKTFIPNIKFLESRSNDISFP